MFSGNGFKLGSSLNNKKYTLVWLTSKFNGVKTTIFVKLKYDSRISEPI